MAISRMQQPQQIQSGIGSLQDPRQRYFLGKLVKKAGRAVKKVFKSPLGKAALIGGLGFGIPGTSFGGLLGRAGFGGAAKGIFGNVGGIGKLLGTGGKLSTIGDLFKVGGKTTGALSIPRMLAGGLGATALAAPFLMGGDDEDEGPVDVMDPRYQVQRARNYYSGAGDAGAGLDFMPQKKYVMQNFYAADGGRAGYANGQLVSPSNDGSRPGYKGLKNIFVTPGPGDNRMPPGKFDFMTETGPMSDRVKEILSNMSEEDIKELKEQGTLFDFIENVIKTPFIIRGGDVEYKAHGGRAGYANGMLVDEDDEEEYIRSGAGQSRRQQKTFLNMGGGAGEAQAEQMLMMEYVKYKNKGGNLSFEQFVKAVMQAQQPEGAGMEQPEAVAMAADGGLMTKVPGYGTPAGTNKFDYPSGGEEVRVGYAGGQLVSPSGDGSRPGYAGESDIGILDVIKSFPNAIKQIFSGETSAFLGGDQAGMNEATVKRGFASDLDTGVIEMIIDMNKKGVGLDTIVSITGADEGSVSNVIDMLNMNIEQKAYGGRIGKQEGGIMATDEASEMIDMGGMEKDYRNEGGFVAMGGKERADDVPARLSKNEFVFTADAVRNAGGGDIDRGAEVMENLMNNLEQGGEVSEDSQGLEGAQAMYDQQQMLQSRVI